MFEYATRGRQESMVDPALQRPSAFDLHEQYCQPDRHAGTKMEPNGHHSTPGAVAMLSHATDWLSGFLSRQLDRLTVVSSRDLRTSRCIGPLRSTPGSSTCQRISLSYYSPLRTSGFPYISA